MCAWCLPDKEASGSIVIYDNFPQRNTLCTGTPAGNQPKPLGEQKSHAERSLAWSLSRPKANLPTCFASLSETSNFSEPQFSRPISTDIYHYTSTCLCHLLCWMLMSTCTGVILI